MISANSPRTGPASKRVHRAAAGPPEDLLELLGHLPGHHDLALAEHLGIASSVARMEDRQHQRPPAAGTPLMAPVPVT
jgi:hypothetical protein